MGTPLQDSLINCSMIQPKHPKVDLEKLMLYTGEIMRFECEMVQLGGQWVCCSGMQAGTGIKGRPGRLPGEVVIDPEERGA